MDRNNNSRDFNQENNGYPSQNDTYHIDVNDFGINDSSSWDDSVDQETIPGNLSIR